LFGLVMLAGCGHVPGAGEQAGPTGSERFREEIRQAVAALQVNARALAETYDRLHDLAADEAGKSADDLQLGYIQKAYLYVHQARLVAVYQIRLWSDFPYIKPDSRVDFVTLRARDLDDAISAMEDAASFLEVYAAFIQDEKTLAEIAAARQLISGNIYLYEKLLATIRPVVRPAAPFSRDPYSSFSRD